METFDVIVTARSNVELESAVFDRQKEMIKQVLAWDGATSTWEMRFSGSRIEHVSNVLNHLFEVARLYGAAVTVRVVPAASEAASHPNDGAPL